MYEALENPGNCPFCALQHKLEENAVQSLMGPSVAYMEDSVRLAINKSGFCAAHFKKLHGAKNRLGLALMLHTHIMEINREMGRLKPKALPEFLEKISKSCYLCDLLQGSFPRYVDTFLSLFVGDEGLRNKLRDAGGFCLPHFEEAVRAGTKKLFGQNLRLFYEIMLEQQKGCMDELEADLDWFVKKFDYRYREEPWKDSKDAIERAIYRISSTNLE